MKVADLVYLCTISKDSHLPKSLMVMLSTPAFRNRQAKVRRNISWIPRLVSGLPSSVSHNLSPSAWPGRRLKYRHSALLVCGPKPHNLDLLCFPKRTTTLRSSRSISLVHRSANSWNLKPLSRNKRRTALSRAANIFWRVVLATFQSESRTAKNLSRCSGW